MFASGIDLRAAAWVLGAWERENHGFRPIFYGFLHSTDCDSSLDFPPSGMCFSIQTDPCAL